MLTWTIGDVTVSALLETEFTLPCHQLFRGATQADIDRIAWLAPHYLTGERLLRLWVQAFLVQTPAKRIVIDTCMGNDKPRAMTGNMLKTDLLQRLEAAGFGREAVDIVLCTHLHIDHVGWNTMLDDGRWVPTFPRARYLMARKELDHWRRETGGDAPAIFADSIKPVLDAGLVDLVEAEHRICEEIRLVPTAGHTPGHVSVAISSKGQEALISGDFLHHPSQLARPDWCASVDYDTAESTATRKRVLAEVADRPVLFIGTHFPAPTAGHVVRDGAGYRLRSGD